VSRQQIESFIPRYEILHPGMKLLCCDFKG
jgi:hypothetical protein